MVSISRRFRQYFPLNPNSQGFRIVIAFQDTESFPPSIIPEFILRSQNFLRRLPITLLFGVASTLDEFEQLLPLNVIKLLEAKAFEVRENDECLKLIVDKVFRREYV